MPADFNRCVYFLTVCHWGSVSKAAEKLRNAIEDSKNRDLSRLIYGLGIRQVGEKAASSLPRALAPWTVSWKREKRS